MSGSVLNKALFGVGPGYIEVLGEISYKKDGNSWIVDGLYQNKPISVVSKVQEAIDLDIENGSFDRIDHILVSPVYFGILFMEGRISLVNMSDADEDLANATITVRGIKFGEREYVVKTMPQDILNNRFGGNFTVATIDVLGSVV